jgi:hypothetical protein
MQYAPFSLRYFADYSMVKRALLILKIWSLKERLILSIFALFYRVVARRSRARDISGCVEKCASRIFPHTQIYQASAAGAREDGA